MIRLTYLTPWEVYWECPDPSELRWLKKQFEFKNTSDLWHKKQFGYFPMVSFLDDIQFRMTHGQALWLRELVKGTNIQLEFTNWIPRFTVDTGPIPEDFLPGVKMRDYQRLATQIIAAQGHGMVCIDTGGGKCLGPDVEVLMFDGTKKKAKEVTVGDRLMGPDSKPRKVLSTCRGHGPMYRIDPVKGDPWTCNDVHILTLRNGKTGEVSDIPLNEYLAMKPQSRFRHLNKQFSVGVDFDNNAELPVDPYFLGVWLGDGSKFRLENGKIKGVGVTKNDKEIVACLEDVAKSHGLRVRSEDSAGTRCPTHNIISDEWQNNDLLNILRDLFSEDYSIPHDYLTSSYDNRMQLLAGVCDTDGYVHHESFEVIQKRREIIDGIIFLARSLGFKVCENKPKIVDGETYWRVLICGDCSLIPTRIKRKQAGKRKQIKNACNTGFKVVAIGDGPYCGWELDGDGRFLLGDFTVTHNTLVMGALLRIILDNTPCSGVLVLINSKDLLNQTAERFASYGVPMDEIGIIHSDISPAKQAKEAEKRVVLSTHMSITKFPGTITKTQYVLCDEAHESIGPLWSQLLSRLPNMLNAIGFTATPWEDQDEEHRMRAIFGTKLVDIPARFLIQQGYLMKPEVIVIRLEYKDRDKKLVEKMSWQDAKKFFVEEDRARNLLPVVCLKKIGGRMLVLFDTISHGKLVKDLYDKNAELHGFESRLADGGSSTKKRKQAIEWFEQDCSENELGKVLLGSRIFDQGTDINGGCDSLFLLGAAKSYRKTKQRVGRGLRKNRSGKLYLLDVDDINHKTLNSWSKNRQKVFEELGVPIRRVTLQEFIAMEM